MTPEKKQSFLLRFRRFQQGREKYFAPKINEALHKQYLIVAKHASEGVSAVHRIDSSGIAAVLKNIYLDAAVIYGSKIRADFAKEGAYEKKNSPVSWLLKHIKTPALELKNRRSIGFSERMHDLVTQYFRTDILATSEEITETTRKLITQVFTDAYAAGLSINEIVKKLENTELSKVRARMIARTETVKSSNLSANFVAKDTGLLLNKTWLATKDSRTRPDHAKIDGHTVGRDDYFNVGNSTMLMPGGTTQADGTPVPADEIIQCRCTHTYSAVRDSAGRLIRV
jgi:uncharacterized protein with gpF-like domain